MTREERIEQLEKELAELKAMGNSLKPDVGEMYSILSDDGDIYTHYWDEREADKDWYSQGNIFKTEAEAIRERDRRALVQRMREYAGGFEPDWSDLGDSKYFIYYNHDAKRFGMSFFTYVDHSISGEVYFKSIEDAQRCLDEMGAELKAWYENV